MGVKKMLESLPPITLLVHGIDGRWYVRGDVTVEHDMDLDQMVYRCAEHLGSGDTPEEALRKATAK